jgi:hypothetical protein
MRKNLLTAVATAAMLLLTANFSSAQCRTLSPTFTIGWGTTINNNKGVVVETGAWGKETALSFYVGVLASTKQTVLETAKDGQAIMGDGPFIMPYARVGVRTYRNEDETFFQQATVVLSKEPELTYRFYKKFGSWHMIGIEPRVVLGNKATVGANFIITCAF